MARTGLGYYYENAGLSTDDLMFYFDFAISGGRDSSLVTNSFSLSGNTGSFWASSSGSGLFSGTILSVNTINWDSDNLTTILINKKTTSGAAILVSTLQSGGSSISGFVLGVNDANKLFVTAYDTETEAYVTNTASFNLGRSNGLSLSKNSNLFTLGKFNFFERELYTELYNFPLTCNTNSNLFCVGGGSGLPSNYQNRFYTGYIDEILLHDKNISENSIESIFKGFYKVEPTYSYGIVSETDSYQYSNLNPITRPIWQEMQSGALDYVRNNIFNTTGIGKIRVISSGSIINGTGYVSGNLTGYTSSQTGYTQVTTGSGVTGFLTSGNVAAASGIVSYVDVTLYPITVFTSGNIYQITAESGISGVTRWTPVYSSPVYQVTETTGFVATTVRSYYGLSFSYTITGMSGNASYVHVADYSNNGNDNILIAHDLNYTGYGTNFRAFKNTNIKYDWFYTENADDTNYINQFNMDGVTMSSPLRTGECLELVYYTATGTGDYNKPQSLSLVSGLFSYGDKETDSDDSFFFINGVYQHPNRLYEDVWVYTGVDILSESGISWIVNTTFSGDYDLNSGYFVTENLYNRNDVGISDNYTVLNLIQRKGYISGNGLTGNFPLSTGSNHALFFINGIKLASGVDYTYSPANTGYLISGNGLSGVTGVLWQISSSGTGSFTLNNSVITGRNSITGTVPEFGSLLFYNGLRQNLNIDYIETSNLDLVHNLNGLYEIETELILNK